MVNGIGSPLSRNPFRYGDTPYPGASVPQAEARGNSGVTGVSQSERSAKVDTGECQTCKNRKYQDASNDPGVSMKAPTSLNPGEAAAKVSAHEQEHVLREQAKAETEGRKVVSQSVQIQTAVCPECGRIYVSGGVTKTTTKLETKAASRPDSQIGNLIDAYA